MGITGKCRAISHGWDYGIPSSRNARFQVEGWFGKNHSFYCVIEMVSDSIADNEADVKGVRDRKSVV